MPDQYRRNLLLGLTVGAAVALSAALPGVASAAIMRPATGCGQPGAAPEGVTPPLPFLKLPFRQRDGVRDLVITQGWVISEDEEPYVGGPGLHRALDFEFANRPDRGFGVPVFAMDSGWAHYSFQHITGEVEIAGVPRQIGWGAGLFVQVIHDNGWVTQYVHLGAVAPGIPYIRPTKEPNSDNWTPTGILRPNEEMIPLSVRVKQGQYLGSNDDTGITDGYLDNFNPDTGTVAQRDRNRYPNWEGGNAQLHVALYRGRDQAGVRRDLIDPLGVYGQITGTADPYNIQSGNFCAGPGNVFLMHNGQFVYAQK